MRWEAFFATAAIACLIILYERPKMKQRPRKDKLAFFGLLAIGLALSMFNLPQLPGPTSWVQSLFRPFGKFMESD